MDLNLLKMRCEDSKQRHVKFYELYSVISSLICIVQNVQFEIPYKVSYFETPGDLSIFFGRLPSIPQTFHERQCRKSVISNYAMA